MVGLPVDDIEIDVHRVAAVIAEQFPALADAPVRLLDGGWDNMVFAVGERLAFRFPRRTLAVAGVARECAVLPLLSLWLPWAIPDARFVGQPCAAFAHPFFGYERMAGTELFTAGLCEEALEKLAVQIGHFLASLHHRDVLENVGHALPKDVHGPQSISRLQHKTLAFLDMLPNTAHVQRWIRQVQQDQQPDDAAPMPAQEVRLVHGDLHLRHVLVQPDGALAGVIDWGDMHVGHPAIDLSLYWTAFAPAGRAAFAAAYGSLSPATLRFARAMGIYSCAALAAHAHSEGRHERVEAAERGLQRCFS